MLSDVWCEEQLKTALWGRYKVRAMRVRQVRSVPGETVTWSVDLGSDVGVEVSQYLNQTVLREANAAMDMSEYCRAAELTVPRVLTDYNNQLVSDEGDLGACAVTEAPKGAAFTRPFTRDQAEHVGKCLAHAHRALAAYPQPASRLHPTETAWALREPERAVAAHEAAALTASRSGLPEQHLREPLQFLRRCLERYTIALRDKAPETSALTDHAVHGRFMPPHIRVGSPAPVITGFTGRRGLPARDLAAAAFEARTVAEGDDWIRAALGLLTSYHASHPTLPATEVAACPRIAVLNYLCTPVTSPVPSAWEHRAQAVSRLIDALPQLDEALTTFIKRPV